MTSSPNLAACLDGGRSKEKGSVDCDGNGDMMGELWEAEMGNRRGPPNCRLPLGADAD